MSFIKNIKVKIIHVCVLHVDAIEKAHEIKEYLEDKYPDIAIEIDAISPVISTHLGLGAIGFGWTIL